MNYFTPHSPQPRNFSFFGTQHRQTANRNLSYRGFVTIRHQSQPGCTRNRTVSNRLKREKTKYAFRLNKKAFCSNNMRTLFFQYPHIVFRSFTHFRKTPCTGFSGKRNPENPFRVSAGFSIRVVPTPMFHNCQSADFERALFKYFSKLSGFSSKAYEPASGTPFVSTAT